MTHCPLATRHKTRSLFSFVRATVSKAVQPEQEWIDSAILVVAFFVFALMLTIVVAAI